MDSPAALNPRNNAYVSSLAFSSQQGGQAILAIGRSDGHLCLYSPLDNEPRFNVEQPSSICCVAFRPTTIARPSKRDSLVFVETEQLLVSDEVGHVWLYAIEWPDKTTQGIFDWDGCITLLCRIIVHNQQICGLAWANDGESFATGGNDNLCHLFETANLLDEAVVSAAEWHIVSGQAFIPQQRPGFAASTFNLSTMYAKHCFTVAAAVKAIAFCPWQRGLIALGGGSNDRRIHFFHTLSGAALATIDCHAQVTSLVWSTTRREIAATFGFAQPEHPYRVAVFSWPSCEIVVKIPWYDEHRALFAIMYPGGPNGLRKDTSTGQTSNTNRRGISQRRSRAARDHIQHSRDRKSEGGLWWSRTEDEGCLVVATSDCSIKFHEIWAEEKRTTEGKSGMLGGSDILDLIHSIDRVDAEIIR